MVYRETPPKEPFDPSRHEITSHTKGPLKGKETWVRKRAIESDEEAGVEAARRNSAHNWVEKVFGKKLSYLDVLTEQGIVEHLGNLKETSIDSNTSKNKRALRIEGEFNGYNIAVDLEFDDNYHFKYKGSIDNQAINPKDAEKIYKKLNPLIVQRYKNKVALEQVEDRLKKKPELNEILKKEQELQEQYKKSAPLVEEFMGKKPKQLGPKKEE